VNNHASAVISAAVVQTFPKSRGFEQKAVSTVRSPFKRMTFFKIGESLRRKNSIRSTAYKQAFEGLKY
jgi:hypothetical protein